MTVRLLTCALLLAGCGDPTSPATPGAVIATAADDYVVMGDDLAALKIDFNAAIDRVRLLFIVGPT
ncbi:MAG: hypothetical protein E2O75_10175 [Chloroflexi bacterium]|nr:MAG: hypothetical protein E2O75_10175 [Chloroflexota bacterium]